MNLGCIGCGFIAGIHAANVERIDGARLVHVCDVREASARDLAARHGVSAWSTDSSRVLEDPEVDAVLICTHPDSHAELAIAAARAGKHVFAEKPLAADVAGCQAIVDAAATAGVNLAVDLKFRHASAVRAVQAAVPEPLVMFAQVAMDPLPDDSPHMDPAAGGGMLENLGGHAFDLLCAFAGSVPESVFAVGSRLPGRERTRFDAITGTLTFPGGCLASFLVSDCGEWPGASKWFYEVSNVETRAVIDDHCRRAVVSGGPGVDEHPTPPHEVGALPALADFVAACEEGCAPLASGADGLRSVAIIEAAYRSLETGAPVALAFAGAG